jgi:hypothetical protein
MGTQFSNPEREKKERILRGDERSQLYYTD